MMKPIRGSEVFWEAAIDVFECHGYFCCWVIEDITKKKRSAEESLFEKHFMHWANGPAWMSTRGSRELNREHRVWAMLFMEQIWKDEYE